MMLSALNKGFLGLVISAVIAATLLSAPTLALAVGYGGGGGGGTYDLLGNVTPAGGPADITGDGDTDILDFNFIIVHLGESVAENPSAGPADLNHDGTIDILDFNILMVHWLS